ncbi:MAG: hypothetical protein EBX41_10510 [Chitinophagia bacterium]|nr:hypothetical protein [Chitinophagia bacterium]
MKKVIINPETIKTINAVECKPQYFYGAIFNREKYVVLPIYENLIGFCSLDVTGKVIQNCSDRLLDELFAKAINAGIAIYQFETQKELGARLAE